MFPVSGNALSCLMLRVLPRCSHCSQILIRQSGLWFFLPYILRPKRYMIFKIVGTLGTNHLNCLFNTDLRCSHCLGTRGNNGNSSRTSPIAPSARVTPPPRHFVCGECAR